MPVHGKNTYVEIDNSAGALTAVQQYTRNAGTNESVDTADSSNFGQNDKTYVIGMTDEKITLGGTFDAVFLTLVRATKTALQNGTLASCTVRVGFEGNASTKQYTTRECLITAINVSASTSDVVTMTVEFQRTGATTEGTYP